MALAASAGLLLMLLPSQVSQASQVAAARAGQAAPVSPAAAPRRPYLDPDLPVRQRVRDLLSRMTLAEKVGQMTQAERADVAEDPSQVASWRLGSLLSGGGSVPEPNTPEAWADMVDDFQEQALSTRLGIPLLYGVDSVHGHANLLGATVFPHNIGLGATRNPRLVRRIADITAQETRATGPNWAFSPCLCVARDDRWGRTYEAFSEDPRIVTRMAGAIRGLQGGNGKRIDRHHVLATAKHFAGDGLTTYGTGSGDYPIDQGVNQVDRATYDRLAVAPYWPAVLKHAVGTVMPSFSSVDWTEDGLGNPVKMHANKELLTGLLKRSMRFRGIVVSDWLAIQQLPGDYEDQVVAAVNAGVDMAMEPGSAERFLTTLTAAVREGRVPVRRIDDAVSRILRAKFTLGLFERPFTDRSRIDRIGSSAHRRVARQAVRESQVLLKNSRGTLPLERRDDVYVAGSNADNIGNQAGGWTLTWQGGSTLELPGNTVLDGIRLRASDVTVSEDASAPVPAGAQGVVVVGETPYTEGFGDVGGPRWGFDPGDNGQLRPEQTMRLSEADRAAVETVCAEAASCTVIVVSGRPLVIEPELLPGIDALVAAWLPGSQGEGVSDTLFGAAPYTGKLSFSWPRAVDEPVNVGDADYDPLFRYGFGLRTR